METEIGWSLGTYIPEGKDEVVEVVYREISNYYDKQTVHTERENVFFINQKSQDVKG